MIGRPEFVECTRAAAAIIASPIAHGVLRIFGRNIPVQRNGGSTGGDWKDIRASFNPRSDLMSLKGAFFARFDHSQDCLAHITACLAHEAVHVEQHASQGNASALQEAVALGRTCEANPNGDSYAAYIGCAMELPAHATMIAVELKIRAMPFDEASLTRKYGYFSARVAGAANADAVLAGLLTEAEIVYNAL